MYIHVHEFVAKTCFEYKPWTIFLWHYWLEIWAHTQIHKYNRRTELLIDFSKPMQCAPQIPQPSILNTNVHIDINYPKWPVIRKYVRLRTYTIPVSVRVPCARCKIYTLCTSAVRGNSVGQPGFCVLAVMSYTTQPLLSGSLSLSLSLADSFSVWLYSTLYRMFHSLTATTTTMYTLHTYADCIMSVLAVV